MLKYQNKTKQEWIDEINAFTVDQKISELIPMVLDDETPTYKYSSLPPSYDSLVMENKPKKSFFEAELVNLKQLELDKIDVIFQDLEEKEALRVRLNALKHGQSAAASLGHPNFSFLFNKIIKEKDSNLVSQLEIKDIEIDKSVRVQNAYDQMSKDVYDEMYEVFGTNNADSAVAYERTWEMMKADPSAWSSLGLKDIMGNALDTEQKVLDFANNRIEAVVAYGKWRMQRIEQFRELKASILS